MRRIAFPALPLLCDILYEGDKHAVFGACAIFYLIEVFCDYVASRRRCYLFVVVCTKLCACNNKLLQISAYFNKDVEDIDND